MEVNIYLLVMRSGEQQPDVSSQSRRLVRELFSAMNSVDYTVFVYKIDVKVATRHVSC